MGIICVVPWCVWSTSAAMYIYSVSQSVQSTSTAMWIYIEGGAPHLVDGAEGGLEALLLEPGGQLPVAAFN